MRPWPCDTVGTGDEHTQYFKTILTTPVRLDNICDFHCGKVAVGKDTHFSERSVKGKRSVCFLPKLTDPLNSL